MEPLEQAVLDLVQHGLRADPVAVRQYARKFVKRGASLGVSAELRTALVGALAGGQSNARILRASPTAVELPSGAALFNYDGEVRQAPILGVKAAEAVQRILAEHSAARDLLSRGLEPTKTVLLTGPPGVGKTMTAHFVAASLELPLVLVDLAQVVSSFLGKTGQNLREVLDYARSERCVLLLDEFDALAKRRDDPADVGELKRIVNVLLLELESWPSHSILVAATNHSDLLDPAVWRRFDLWIPIELPDLLGRASILERALGDVNVACDPDGSKLLAALTDSWSGSDLTRLARDAARRLFLRQDTTAVIALVHALDGSLLTTAEGKARVARVGHAAGLSYRSLGRMLDTAHVTVAEWAKKRDQQPEAING